MAKEWRHYTCLVGSNTWVHKKLSCFYLIFVFFFLTRLISLFHYVDYFFVFLRWLSLWHFVLVCSRFFFPIVFHFFVWALPIMVFVVVLATCKALHHGVVVVLAPRGVLIVLFMVFNYLWHSSLRCSWWCLTIPITLCHGVFHCFIVVFMVL